MAIRVPESAPEAETEARSLLIPLLLLTAAALAMRVAFLLLEPAVGPVADERTWTNWAVEALVTPRVSFNPLRTRMIFYPPLYPYFIAVFFKAFGTLVAVKWAQVLVGALLVPAIGLVGARAFGRRVGLVSAAIVAFYPELVWFSVHFWSETLFMVFLWWGLERVLAADLDGTRATTAAAGLLWGLAILTRETVLYFVPVVALWLAFRRGRTGLAQGASFLLATVLTVAPWTCRNWLVFRDFVPVATAGGLNLYQGNAPLTREEVYARYEAVQGRVEQYRWAREQGIRAILDRQPWWILEKLRDEMPNFWEADSQPLYHVKRGAYGPVPAATAALAAVVVLAPYLGVLALFVGGLAGLPWDRTRGLLVVFLLYYTAIHVVTHGYARYRLPAMPVVFLLAAWAWVAWRERAFPPWTRLRKVLAAVTAATLLASLLPSLGRNVEHPAFGLRDPGGDPAESLRP